MRLALLASGFQGIMLKVKPVSATSFPILQVLGVKIILCQTADLLQAWRRWATESAPKPAPFATAPLGVKTFFSLFFNPRRRAFYANLTFVYVEDAALAFAVGLALRRKSKRSSERNSSNRRLFLSPFSSERFFASLLSFYLTPQLKHGVERCFSCLFIGLGRTQLAHFKRYLQLFVTQTSGKLNKRLMFLPALAAKNTAQTETFIKKAAPEVLFIQESLRQSLGSFHRFQGSALVFFVPRAMELYSAERKQRRPLLPPRLPRKAQRPLFPWHFFLVWHGGFSLPAYLLFLLVFVLLKKKIKKISF